MQLFTFNGQSEKESKLGLGWYETTFRGYDPQLGRFHQIDPLGRLVYRDKSYQFGYNNPVLFNDPTGLYIDCTTDDNDFTALAEKYAVKAEKIVDEQPTTGFENYVEDIYTKAKDVVSQAIKTTEDKFRRDKKTSEKLVEKTNTLFEDTQGLILTGLGLAGKALFIYGSAALTSIFGAVVGGGGKYAFGVGHKAVSLAGEIAGNHLMNDADWAEKFLEIISDPTSEIHFSLDDVDQTVMEMILDPSRSSTNWEMNQLYQNKDAFERTTFHHNGKTYIGYGALKVKPW